MNAGGGAEHLCYHFGLAFGDALPLGSFIVRTSNFRSEGEASLPFACALRLLFPPAFGSWSLPLWRCSLVFGRWFPSCLELRSGSVCQYSLFGFRRGGLSPGDPVRPFPEGQSGFVVVPMTL